MTLDFRTGPTFFLIVGLSENSPVTYEYKLAYKDPYCFLLVSLSKYFWTQ